MKSENISSPQLSEVKRRERRAPGLAALVLALFISLGDAQQPPVKVKNFKASESYEAPHQAQMKFLLEGAEAEPLTSGRYLVKELKLQTFLQDGKRELQVEAPQCVYDSQAH